MACLFPGSRPHKALAGCGKMLVACPHGCGRSAPCIKDGCFPLLLSLPGETRVREQAAEILFSAACWRLFGGAAVLCGEGLPLPPAIEFLTPPGEPLRAFDRQLAGDEQLALNPVKAARIGTQ